MPTYKISQLTTATAVSATNQFEINQNGTSKSVEVSVIDAYIKSTSNLPVVVSVSSASNAVRITQTGTGNALVVEDSTNPDSSPFVVDTTGNVGVGTASPDAALTVNTIASFGAGTAALPSIAAKGDLNTGIWFPAVDEIAFSTAGTEDFRIGPVGQLGLQGANYGTSGQVLTSGGSAAAPSWQTISTTPPQLQSQTFGSSGTWTAPAGVTRAIVTLIGGGGGNSGFTSCFSILGGVGGFLIAAVTVSPGTAYTVTIGAGGTGGAVTATGGTGGTTSFGALASATGGGGGNWSTGVTGANGTATTSGTVIRNSFAAGRGSLFDGNSYSNFTSGNQAGLAWSATSIYAAGNPGSGNFGNQGCGALGGGLMIQWVG